MPLQRKLNLFDATLLVVGNVVGAGIFTASGFPAKELCDPWLFLGVWAIGGLLSLCGALTYAEMAGMYPRSGGDYLFLKGAYGPWAGFLLGWISFWVITPGSIGVLSISMAKYVMGLAGFTGTGSEKVLAVGLIALFSFLNYRGVRLGSVTQNAWTLGSVTLLAVLIVYGLLSGKGDWGHFVSTGHGQAAGLSRMLGPAMIAVIFAYSGWFVSAYIGDEVKRAGRNLPLSLLLGTGAVTILYILANTVYLYALPIGDLGGIINVGQVAARRLFGGPVVPVVGTAIILAIGASINATILAGARLSYALASDLRLRYSLDRLHPKHNTPHVAILVQACMAALFVVFESFESILSSTVFIMLLSSIASGTAHTVLRRKEPLHPRPYRTWGAPWVPLLFVAAYAWIAAQIVIASPGRSLIGLAVAASGIPAYYLVRVRGRQTDAQKIA